MKYRTWLFACLIATAAALSACESREAAEAEPAQAPPAEAEAEQAAQAADEAPADPEEGVAKEVVLVEVAAEGTEFDPAVEPAQIPEGAWYCDMGTVHYARGEKGDGKCAVCGMMLKQKTAGAEAVEGDHDHGEHMDGQMPEGDSAEPAAE